MPQPTSPASTLRLCRGLTAAFMAVAVCALVLVPSPALAYTPMGEVLCFVLDTIVFGAGRGFATLGVVAVGVAATLGKASWGLCMTIAAGMGILFGSAEIVSLLGIGAGAC